MKNCRNSRIMFVGEKRERERKEKIADSPNNSLLGRIIVT